MGLIPTASSVLLLFGLLLSGAPSANFDFETVRIIAERVGVVGGSLLVLASVVMALAIQPLQFRMVQLLEGYWTPVQLEKVAQIGVAWQRTRRKALARRMNTKRSLLESMPFEAQRVRREQMQAAAFNLRLRFPREDRLLPTGLGNILRAAEDQHGRRYEIEAVTIWPRLFPLLPDKFAADLENEVQQLDVSVRLAVTWSFTSALAMVVLTLGPGSLWSNPAWLILPILCLVLSAVSYVGAKESALAHGQDIEVALDLYRGLVRDAMYMAKPGRLAEERVQFRTLMELFQAREARLDLDFNLRSD